MIRLLPAIRAGAALLLLLLAWSPGGSRADSLSFRFEPNYVVADTTTLAGGNETTRRASTLMQIYTLSLDKGLFPLLRFGATGSYRWTLSSARSSDAPPAESEGRRWNLDARLAAGDPVLGGVLFYNQGQRSDRTMADGLITTSPTFQNDVIGFTGLWRPDRLPEVQLLLTHERQRDEDRQLSDMTTDNARLLLTYRPEPRLELWGRLAYHDSADRVSGQETRAFGEDLRAAYSDEWLDRRLSLYANYLLTAAQSDTTVSGSGGSILVQRFPLLGLSTVEAPPPTETPARVTLRPNGLLLDGDTAAGAGVDIGFGTGPADTAWRDLGAQFADTVTPVNLLYVWVDKPLPAGVAGAFTWDAFRSDDNLNWTPVPLAGPVTFGLFQNRFEIPIAETQAKYLKVVTRPLAVGVTIDDQYRSIRVTELQCYQTLPAGAGRSLSTIAGQASLTSRFHILRSKLIYDLSASLSHSNSRSPVWNVTNALRFDQRLGRILGLAALLERADGNLATGGHVAGTRWTATLTADPLATLGASVTYTGDFVQTGSGDTWSNALSLLARATPYRGVDVFGIAGHSIATDGAGRTVTSDTATASVAVVPNPKLSMSGSYVFSYAFKSGGGRPDESTTTWRVDGTASFTPVPALSASGGVSYAETDRVGQTLVNLAANFSPFPAGP